MMISQSLSGVLDEYTRQTNSHDFTQVAHLIASDAVFWFREGSFKGLPSIQKAFEATWAMIADEVYSIENLEWVAADDHIAVCLYTFHWKGLVVGQPASGSGRGTSVLQRINCHWKVVHEHLSSASQ